MARRRRDDVEADVGAELFVTLFVPPFCAAGAGRDGMDGRGGDGRGRAEQGRAGQGKAGQGKGS